MMSRPRLAGLCLSLVAAWIARATDSFILPHEGPAGDDGGPSATRPTRRPVSLSFMGNVPIEDPWIPGQGPDWDRAMGPELFRDHHWLHVSFMRWYQERHRGSPISAEDRRELRRFAGLDCRRSKAAATTLVLFLEWFDRSGKREAYLRTLQAYLRFIGDSRSSYGHHGTGLLGFLLERRSRECLAMQLLRSKTLESLSAREIEPLVNQYREILGTPGDLARALEGEARVLRDRQTDLYRSDYELRRMQKGSEEYLDYYSDTARIASASSSFEGFASLIRSYHGWRRDARGAPSDASRSWCKDFDRLSEILPDLRYRRYGVVGAETPTEELRIKAIRNYFDAMGVPNVGRLYLEAAGCWARERLAFFRLGLMHHHKATGRPADSLDILLRGADPRIAHDPFDGRPFPYGPDGVTIRD